jgi:glycosyltransferase involved in cell wall biosynthesis
VTSRRSYAVITPARDEQENLARLAASLTSQEAMPDAWVIVDNGSRDGTQDLAAELASRHPWIRIVTAPAAQGLVRGGPVVRAFHVGLAALEPRPTFVAKVDADVSLSPSFFATLLSAFEADATLGLASGACHELQDGAWVRRFGTGDNVWGAARMYRRECLEDVLPLEERMGWDGIDVIKANVCGWRTAALLDLPFRHHRPEAVRDNAPRSAWVAQGRAAYYMGYRFSYLLARTLYRIRDDRSAASMVTGYLAGMVQREDRVAPSVRSHVRRQQRWRHLPVRAREALGRPAT